MDGVLANFNYGAVAMYHVGEVAEALRWWAFKFSGKGVEADRLSDLLAEAAKIADEIEA